MGLIGAFATETVMTWHKTEPTARCNQSRRRKVLWSADEFFCLFCLCDRKFGAIQLGITLAIIFFMSFIPYVDWAAHLGGFMIGAMIGVIYFAVESDHPQVRKLGPYVAAALLVIYFALGFALFYTVVNVDEGAEV
jgi:hypothetical protein